MKAKTIIVILLLVIGSMALAFHLGRLSQGNQELSEKKSASGNAPEKPNGDFRSEGCQGKGIVNLTSPPRPMDQIAFIEPMGLMTGDHVTPIDHQYYFPYNFRPGSEISLDDLKDVLAPADGIITAIDRMPDFFSVKNHEFKDYRLTLHYTCDLYSIYIHIYQLSPEIENQVKDLAPGKTKMVSIPVKSGDIIGKANSFDFSLVNNNVILPGFIVPEHYSREPWKIHTVDPSGYFAEPLRSQLLEKTIRKAEPYGGKIDHDIDGKLIGNWFKEGTNGYQGIKEPEYWTTHASFSPDTLDSSHFIISMGDFKGEARQFGAKGNSPNPKDVGVNSGMVKYELVGYSYSNTDGSNWDGTTPPKGLKAINKDEYVVEGIVLVQLIEDRKLKLEIIPDKQASDVSGFSDSAMIYER